MSIFKAIVPTNHPDFQKALKLQRIYTSQFVSILKKWRGVLLGKIGLAIKNSCKCLCVPYSTKPYPNKTPIKLRSAGFQPCAACASHKTQNPTLRKNIHTTQNPHNKNTIKLRSAGFQPCEKCAKSP